MIERLRLAKTPEKIIICTSTVEQDDRLEEFAKAEGVNCFRGHPDDVLVRMRDAASVFEVDKVVSCTADNPFVDPVYIDKLIEFHDYNGNDFSKVEGLPFGTFSYLLNREAIEKACEIKDEVDTEVWGGYFTETNLFQWGILHVDDENVRWSNLRLTVDTQEDFDLVNKIFTELLDEEKGVFSLEEIIEYIKSDMSMLDINKDVKQKPGLPIKLKESNE